MKQVQVSYSNSNTAAAGRGSIRSIRACVTQAIIRRGAWVNEEQTTTGNYTPGLLQILQSNKNRSRVVCTPFYEQTG